MKTPDISTSSQKENKSLTKIPHELLWLAPVALVTLACRSTDLYLGIAIPLGIALLCVFSKTFTREDTLKNESRTGSIEE